MLPDESDVTSQVSPAAHGALVTGLHLIAEFVLPTQLPSEEGLAGTLHAKTVATLTPASIGLEWAPMSQPDTPDASSAPTAASSAPRPTRRSQRGTSA
jgi:hypothetical protein